MNIKKTSLIYKFNAWYEKRYLSNESPVIFERVVKTTCNLASITVGRILRIGLGAIVTLLCKDIFLPNHTLISKKDVYAFIDYNTHTISEIIGTTWLMCTLTAVLFVCYIIFPVFLLFKFIKNVICRPVSFAE